MTNPFDWSYLTATTRETPVFGPLSVTYLIVFGGLFILSALAYYDAPRRFKSDRIRRDAVRKGSELLLWVTGVGLVFFGIRVMQFEFLTFERRIWLYLMMLILVAVLAYFVYYTRTILPAQLAERERHRVRKQYIPPHGSSKSRKRTAR